MALTPGGGRSPSTQTPPSPPPPSPPRAPRDQRAPQAPNARVAATSVLRWGVLIGGLVIIADLATIAIEQRLVGADVQGSLDTADLIINVILLAFVGVAVVRETGVVYLAALAGLVAGLLDGLVVAALNSVAPRTASGSAPDVDILWNMALGTLFATASALVNRLLSRRAGPGRR